MPPTRRELATLIGLALLTGAAYFVTCRLISSPTEVVMPAWVPFVPLLTIPYLLQVVASYVLAMCIRDRTLRHAVFKAYFLAIAAVFSIWLTFPTMMLRPPAPHGGWNWPYAVMAGADLPVHIFPAGHILMPVLLVWAVWYERPRWLWWLVPSQVVGAVGIASVWQHRPIDILVGAVLAALAGLAMHVENAGRAHRAARVVVRSRSVRE